MHTAYRVHQLLKLPLTIEYIRAFEDSLLVGTREGHLLMYSVKVNMPEFIILDHLYMEGAEHNMCTSTGERSSRHP